MPSISTADPTASAASLCGCADGLDIVEDGTVVDSWPYDDIRRADGAGLLRLSRSNSIAAGAPRDRRRSDQGGHRSRCAALEAGRGGAAQIGRIVVWSLAAVCSIVAGHLYGIPFAADRLAPLVPMAVEKRIGEAVDGQVRLLFGGKVCTGAEGQAAFTTLVDKLSAPAASTRRSTRRCCRPRCQRLRAAGRQGLPAGRTAAAGATMPMRSPASWRMSLGM